ncbi:hypothetical protein BDZ94DRAFT_942504 [Collybia nuda]|uniref:CxC2-like cysteine cluster KDZ transposase-associated domain-containing protein n=1 Tax=Collybia nuda TaxID=64659 RepID=A0A9P6CAN0_9AGAR|nr:hypothetical protein BDZ94DRAFT_942504 [Collybia nuda]
MCVSCIVKGHTLLPFHIVQEWTGLFFRRVSLMTLGLRVQMGHVAGDSCPNPTSASKDGFVVVDIDRIHTIGLDFCNCHLATGRHIQLLRARLYPATTISPQSAATFRVLEFFQLLSFMSKVSAYEFYHTLAQRTNNTGVGEIPVGSYMFIFC